MSYDGSPDDFDFQVGDWKVLHRRLNERLTGAGAWEEFGGACSMRKILAGLGNIEDNLIDLPGGAYRAAALRAFDPSAHTWAIWWLDARSPHSLDVPVIGGFRDGVGVFYADDTLNQRPIRVRFTWRETRSDRPIWEQAFSPDHGKSWEVNWVMQFRR